ncbi:MAG: RidA family protein [Sphingomonas bacterium]|nr:RidA family protein [Sphingomonas bacterium]
MRRLIIGGMVAACLSASASIAKDGIVRTGPADAAIAATVALPADAKLVYVSGTVPDAVNPQAPQGSVERFGDTEAQTRSVLAKIEALLKAQGLGLGDVVMMRVFLVAPPGQARMDFAGMMRGYRAYFGTPQQPLKTARSTMQVAGLVDPGWLVEIEATAARR